MRTRLVAIGALLAVLIVGGGTWVYAASSTKTVNVCVGKKNAVVSATKKGSCPKGSKVTPINQTGPAGPAGKPGAPGAPGSSGSPGANGSSGPTATVTVTAEPSDDPTIDGGTP